MIARLMTAVLGLYGLGLATAFFMGQNTGLTTQFSAGSAPEVSWLDKIFFLGPVLSILATLIQGIWAIASLLTWSIPGAPGAMLSVLTYLMTGYVVIIIVMILRGESD